MDSLLVLAKLAPDEERVLSAIAATSNLKLVTCSKVESAIAWLSAEELRVLVFKADLVGADRFCQAVRSRPALAGVPLIALVSDWSDPLVEKLYAHGIDDAIMDRFGPGFVARLRRLPDRLARPPRRGAAVVAEPDRNRQNLVARVLGNAGYDVKTARDATALSFFVREHKPRLVVGSVALGAPRALISEARRAGCSAPWVVTARRRELPRWAESLAGLERVSVVAATSSPEVVLYAANELMRGEEQPARSEVRHLYATSVLFREPGEESDELGFTYNVSGRGLFVRTLAPPEGDAVWLELRPPKSRRRVRLEGRVTWRRPYVPTAASTGPPGFGVQISAGLSDGVAHYREQALAFAASAHASQLAVQRMHTARLGDARTSGEYMLIEVPSESTVPVLSAVGERRSVPPTAEAVDDEWERLTDGAADAPEEVGAATVEPETLSAAGEDETDDDAEEIEPEEDIDALPERPPAVRSGSSAPTSFPSPAPERRGWRTILVPLAVGACAGGLAAGVHVAWSARAPARPSRAAALEARAPAPAASALAPLPAATTPAPPPSLSPRLGPSAAPPALPASDAGPEAAPPDSRALNWDQGHLLVRAPGADDVYATGFRVGRTNVPNVTKCGLRWVRLGRGDPPTWISPGLTVDVKCRELTTVSLAPDR